MLDGREVHFYVNFPLYDLHIVYNRDKFTLQHLTPKTRGSKDGFIASYHAMCEQWPSFL